MASRAYKRDSKGRFAGGGGAVSTTFGRAGGFASASLRARAANARTIKQQSLAMTKSKASRRDLVKIGVGVGLIGLSFGLDTPAGAAAGRAFSNGVAQADYSGRKGAYGAAVQATRLVLNNSAAARRAFSPIGSDSRTVKGQTIKARRTPTPALGRKTRMLTR